MAREPGKGIPRRDDPNERRDIDLVGKLDSALRNPPQTRAPLPVSFHCPVHGLCDAADAGQHTGCVAEDD